MFVDWLHRPYRASTSPELGFFREWKISNKYLSLSDDELILMNLEDIETQAPGKQQGSSNGWSMKNLVEDDKLFLKVKSELDWTCVEKVHLSILFTKKDLDKEVE